MKKITFILLVSITTLLYNYSNAQVVVCENSSCTANDYNLDSFYLGDAAGNRFDAGYCDPGEPVSAHIWTNFSANSNASRYTLYLHYNLYIDGVFIDTIDECFFQGQPIPTDVSLDIYDFSWSCGSVIELRDFYMSWQPNPNANCGCSNSKCFSEPSIFVDGPLIANFVFNPSCLSAYTLDFISTTSGGTPPYTYLWDFGDGTTSTEESPSHTYDSTGPYIVNLTVYDVDDFDYQEYEIVDFNPNLPPELFAPPNENIEGCDETALNSFPLSLVPVEITEPQFNSIGGNLILSSAIVSLTYVDTISGTCPTTITRTFSVTDSCDHSTTDTQVIIINDTTFPTASNPETITVQCTSDIPAPNTNVITDAADNCSNVTLAFVQESSDNSSCPEILTRIYSITDDCGNTIEVTQNIIINDDILPTASIPAISYVQCIGDIPVPDINIINNANDNCSVPVITFVSETSFADTCPLTINRVYNVADDCGNSINLTHTIIVDDTTDPTATAPSDLNVQCSSDIPSPDISTVTNVSDNCGVPVVEFVTDISNSGACPEIISRIYSVTDDCGNQILLTQNITVVDDIQPTASVPPPINVQCVSDVPAPDISIISDAVDNCSTPIVSFISDISTGQCPQLILRTYHIEDSCGNFIEIIQDININDNIAPTASNPLPIYFDCSSGIPEPDSAVVTDAVDNCSIPVIAFVSDTSDGLCPETITRIYSVTDECGNSINVTQEIISTDTEAPVLTGPLNDETVDCLAIPNAPNLVFSDNCSTDLFVAYTETNTNMNDTVDYDITREWIVTDDCGNQSIFTQVIHVIIANCIVSACNSCGPVDDTIPPTASNPADINVNCTDDIPAPDPSVVIDEADNCVPPVVAFVSETVNVDCFQKVERVYSVTDECGNVIYVSHFINVIDNIFPTASNPAALNVDCTDNIPAPDINVVTDEADNCSIPSVAFVSDVADNSSCSLRIIRTYSVTDTCGNSIQVQQEINVIDNVPPTATAPNNLDVTCLSEVPIPNTNDVTFVSDNCSNTSVDFISDVSDNNICPETITRTYRVSDDCDNYIDVIQYISIYDDIAPTASNPATLQFSCPGDVEAPNINVVTDASDNCSTPIVDFVSEISDNNSCPETITRTYSVTDICGNSINVYQTIIVNDEINPTASNPIPVEVSENSSIPAPDTLVVIDEADNCSVPTVSFVSESSDNQSCPETISRIYSITDDCGNSINVEHLIIVNDNVAPTASNPQTLTFSCSSDVPSPDINVVTDAADNNSAPTVSFISESSNANSCPEIITRIYRVTDNCGNYIDVSQIIIIDDDIPPTASNPSTIEIYDTANIPAADINVVIDEADNCSVPTVAFVNEISNNDTCQLVLTRTYSITDDCGNSINVSHEIIVYDTEAPTASNPADVQLSCSSEIPAPDINTIFDAVDNYSIATVSFVSDVSNEQTCPEIITRTYRIIDECGNYTDISYNFIIDDDINPTASNPQSITVAHISEVPAVDAEVVIDEADNCSIPLVEFVSEISDNQSCPETLTRIYSITDACGNSINVSHIIIINDIEAPIANNLNDITLSCITEIPAPDTSIVVATDNTVNTTVNFISDVSDNNSCPEIITRTYDVSDDCGNSIVVTQLFTIYDDVAPTASNPQSLQFSCSTQVPPADINVITDAADNCSTPVVAFVSETSDNQICPETLTRIYSVTDECGNSINVSQTIIIYDDIAPTASNPQDISVDNYNEIPAIDVNVVIDESDNCSIPLVEFVSETTENFNCEDIITRIYRITDACGNFIDVSHTITINHSGNPQPIRIDSSELNCASEIPAPYTIATISEIAQNINSVNLISENSNNQTCPEIITRVYNLTDDCNNSFTVEHQFNIFDIIPPTASDLDPITVDCFDNVPNPNVGIITDAEDNCAIPTITFISDTREDYKCGGSIIRIYNVADDCGNSIDVSQIIYVEDLTPPALVSPLDNEITLYCGEVPAIPEIEFVDNCSSSVHINFYEEISANNGDDYNYDIFRIWTATDDCNNTIRISQTIHMNIDYDQYSESISLCLDEEPINLNDLVDLDANGVWESDYMHVLNEMVFDPYLLPQGDYAFSYTVQNNECIYFKEININVNDDCIEYPCIRSISDVNISILVTPNGDMKNETFNVSYSLNSDIQDEFKCDIKTKVKIFNRWGTKVYQSDDYHNTWKGEAPAGAIGFREKLPAGTYYYVVDLVNSGIKPIQGYILLGVEDK